MVIGKLEMFVGKNPYWIIILILFGKEALLNMKKIIDVLAKGIIFCFCFASCRVGYIREEECDQPAYNKWLNLSF